ncbi:MAG: riboflavin synthase [Clostridia bacterium]|nr:riboflavin synthase [Clostridia bacterium]
MFTGIIEEIGKVKSIVKSAKSAKITVQAKKVLEDVKMGDSIATNGVCLTVTRFTKTEFTVDVMAETMRKSNLDLLSDGSPVNLERALRLGDRLGGHMVSGHVDGLGTIEGTLKEENAIWVTIGADASILRYVIPKGSIAIDGISLTVAYVDDTCFKVSVIPHTKDETTLLGKSIGAKVNLECDLVGKYIEKLVLGKTNEIHEDHKSIDLDFLTRNGFA